jgi:two-component system OmpR family response regulator
MRILLIEDDPMIGSELQGALRNDGIAVDWIQDGSQGFSAIQLEPYDLILLDLGLPGMDGTELLRKVRLGGNKTPILVITARDTLDDRIKGLDLGADDYIIKPFELKELQARIRATLRRHHGFASDQLTNGLMTLDIQTHEVWCHADLNTTAPQVLSNREFSVLHALMSRPGAILSRNELESRVYGWGEEVESNAIEYLIHSLRKKLGSRQIKNVRGVGWMVDKPK